MNKSFKRYGKKRWIDTALSKPYKLKRALLIACVHGNHANAAYAAQAIHSQIATTKEEKISKAFAIAGSIIDANIQAVNILKPLKGIRI
jgi:hypothetical protein